MKIGSWVGFISSCLLVTSCLGAEPTIIEEPNDVTVKQGDDVTLRCVVEHLPSEDLSPVQWTRDDFALGFDRNLSNWDRYSMIGDISIGEYNLHIKNVNLQEDESQYECQVTMYYMRTRKASVTVQVPPNGPVIDKTSDDGVTVNAVAGVENAFTCRAFGGKPAAKLTWFKNGVEITENIVNVISGPSNKLFNTTATLRVTPSVDDVDDTYACVMKSDVMDNMASAMMKLNVQKPPIVSVSLPPSIGVGDYVRAECRAVADPPVQSYRWFVNDQVQSGETSSTFHINDISKNLHNSVLGCQARNEAGYSEINRVTIDLQYPPTYVSGSSDQTVEIGDNVTLSCEWDSNPKPLVSWRKAGSDVILGEGGSLVLPNLQQEDSGSYVCSADAGSIGKNHAAIGLRVRGPPVLSSPFTQFAMIGEDSVVKCELNSYPGIERVTWTWKDKETTFTLTGNASMTSSGDVTSDDSDVKYMGKVEERAASLLILGTAPQDLHTYSCAIENIYGVSNMEIVLEEGESDDGDVIMIIIAVACAVGGLVLIVLLVVCVKCVKSRRQRKSTNFDKEMKNTSKSSKSQARNYTEDETIPIHHQRELAEDFNVRSSLSSQVGGGESSVDGSDDTNPTPTSGQDDGYHTEEAHSWNRSEHPGGKSSSTASPAKSSIVNSYHPGAFMMPPHPEEEPMFPDASNYPPTSYNDLYPSHTMSPTRYPYDPTALVNPSTIRSASVLGDRFSPPVNYTQRKMSDASAPAASNYALTPDYYPPRTYTPMHDFGSAAGFGGNRNTPIPSTVTGSVDPFYQPPIQGGSSQSSLDRIERGSALSASAVAARAIDPYENATRMSHMSSRLSQSSRSSDFLRPLQARMATHV